MSRTPQPWSPMRQLLGHSSIVALLLLGFGASAAVACAGGSSSRASDNFVDKTAQAAGSAGADAGLQLLDARDVLIGLQNYLRQETPLRTTAVPWNLVDDKMTVIPYSGTTFMLAASGDVPGVSRGTTNQPLIDASLTSMQLAISDYFGNQSFKKSNAIMAPYPITVDTYDKGSLKCMLSTENRAFPSLFCGRYDANADSMRRELLPVTNTTPDRVCDVQKVLGDYAFGGCSTRGTGVVWYAVKQGGVWMSVWGGQNIISCKPVREYNIPKAIYDECTDKY